MTETVYRAVGLRVQMIREALGVNQSDLAKRTGYTRTSITNIEAGRQRLQLHQVEKLAGGLGVTSKHLMRGIWW